MANNGPDKKAADSVQAQGDALASAHPESFEQALTELEDLVRRMEQGDLSLEGSLAAYRRGAGLVTFCRQALADVQQQVKVLEGDLLRPFEADSGTAA
jgi:exodeoxyribonuclease VII small subunit